MNVSGVKAAAPRAPPLSKSSAKRGSTAADDEDDDGAPTAGEGGGWDPHFKPSAASAAVGRFASQLAPTPLQLLENAAAERAAAETGPSAPRTRARAAPCSVPTPHWRRAARARTNAPSLATRRPAWYWR